MGLQDRAEMIARLSNSPEAKMLDSLIESIQELTRERDALRAALKDLEFRGVLDQRPTDPGPVARARESALAVLRGSH